MAEQIITAQQRYNQSQKGKIRKKRYYEKYKQTKNGKMAHSLAQQKYITLYPERIKATNAINYAVATGKLERAYRQRCFVCRFKRAKAYHHPDYSQPLYVFPVCTECHRIIHN